MRIGDLSRLVKLHRPTRVGDGQGGAAETLEHVATVWASLEYKSSAERLAGDRYQERERLVVGMRYRGDVRQGWTVEVDGRRLFVTGARDHNLGRKRFTVLECEAR